MELEKLNAWRPLLAEELKKPYFAALAERVDAAYGTQTVFPPREDLFNAFALTPPEAVRVVILGQDPYHEPGQAHGLAFSVRRGVKLPPSLRNIYQELESDLGISPAKDGDLSAWARQGVLLLNTVLTVESGRANSHKNFGWQRAAFCICRGGQGRPPPYKVWRKRFTAWQRCGSRSCAASGAAAPRAAASAPQRRRDKRSGRASTRAADSQPQSARHGQSR